MNSIKKIFYLKKMDKFLLLNYPLVWSLRLHYVIFYNFLIFCIILYIMAHYKFGMYQVLYIYQYLFPFTILIFIYWAYSYKKHISLEKYNKLPHPVAEYLLYMLSLYLVVFPFAITITISLDFVEEHRPKTSELKILDYSFVKNRYKMTCSKDKNGIDIFDENSTKICIGDKNKFDRIVLTWSSQENSENIKEEDVIDAQNNLKFLQDESSLFHLKMLDIFFSIYIPILIFFFKYSGYKKSIRIMQFLLVYSGSYIILYLFLGERADELSEYLNIYVDIILIFFLFTPLLLLYKIFKKYRLIFFVQIVISLIFTLLLMIGFHTKIPEARGFIAVLIILIFIKPIRNHILYLNSKPIE